jgi:hypothetical protein
MVIFYSYVSLPEGMGIELATLVFFCGDKKVRSVAFTEVKAVCWTSDDFHLVSTGQDGATYEYDILKEGRRVSDARTEHL